MMIAAIIFVVVAATAMLMASRSFEREVTLKRELLSAAASGHAAAVADPVAAGSRSGALAALRGIRSLPDVVQADIRNSDGSVLAQLGTGAVLIRPGAKDRNPATADLWNSHQLSIEIPIVHNGQQIGQLGMLADTSEMRESILKQLRITALTALMAILVGVGLALRMITRMTRPLFKLSVQMSAFADDRAADYECITGGDDETGILATAFSDMVSSIKKRDQKLAQHMETLEETIEERTHDLNIAKDVAEAANAAKSDFLATMSHEIRTPMNGMLVMAEMLSAADLSTRHRRYAEIIARSGNSLLTIINDILDMSKIESGKLDLEEQAVSLDTLVNDVATLFWERSREKGVELTCYVSSDVPAEIVIDPTRINQIITNLVNNALKFTESGSVQIRITAKPSQTGAYAQIKIEVEDTGIGIPQDKLETIFDAFSQADQSTTRRFGGTGLGLAVCRKLADAMGGTISVSSQMGKGSIFCLELEAPIATVAPTFSAHPFNVGVNIADNSIAQSVRRFLEDAGCVFTSEQTDFSITTSNTLAALKSPATGPQIILSDIGDTLAGDMLRLKLAVDLLPNPFTRFDMIDLLARAETKAYRGIEALNSGKAHTTYPDFEGLRILAADDNAVNREVLREALSTLNVEVDFAENGRQAADMAKAHHYDAVFMDGSMPIMSGFEATRAICEYEAYMNKKPTPIIALTAQVSGTTQEAWQAAGAQHYIAKPFTLERLSAVLSNLGQGTAYTNIDARSNAPTLDQPAAQIFNAETIASLNALGASSGRDLRARVWSLFRVKAPENVEALAILAKTQSSISDVARQAHALKSMCLSAGLERLAAACDDIETAATQDQSWADVSTAIQQAEAIFEETLSAMSETEPAQQELSA
ncbi:MAG: ATP-binding protein [Hyphomonadaceae bacterium]